MKTKDNTKKSYNFEEALNKLEEIVKEMESGNLSLEDALQNYLEGVKLKELCEKKLNEAKTKIENINLNKS